MTKQEIIDYMYENHVQGDFKIEEMAEDLAQPEVIMCKDCRKHNMTAAKAESIAEMCPLTTIRGKAKGHEFDYQYCAYGELRGDSDEND